MANSKALYFAALLPPPKLKEEIRQLKLEIKEKVGASHALKLPAHITLLPPFKMESHGENNLFETLESVSSETPFFEVELDGFGSFGQRVIFLNVINPERVTLLHRKLLQSTQTITGANPEGSFHPHVTLATRDLGPRDFKTVWQEYKGRTYSSNFTATAITLFKHNGKTWDILKEFPL